MDAEPGTVSARQRLGRRELFKKEQEKAKGDSCGTSTTIMVLLAAGTTSTIGSTETTTSWLLLLGMSTKKSRSRTAEVATPPTTSREVGTKFLDSWKIDLGSSPKL